MTSITDLLGDAKVDSLHTVVESGGNKYLCFTKLNPDAWILCVSDGYDLWRQDIDTDELKALRDLAEVNTVDAYLARFRSAFVAGDVQVAQSGFKIDLRIGQGAKNLNFELFEAKAIEKKTELSAVLFRLAEAASDLENKLEKANKTIDSLKQHKGPAGGGLFDVDHSSKRNQPKVQPKKTGMSVINPQSKKRKAATGVQFDDDDALK